MADGKAGLDEGGNRSSLAYAGVVAIAIVCVTIVTILFMQKGNEPSISRIGIGKSEAIMVDASRRAVLHSDSGIICSEPSPDAFATVANALLLKGGYNDTTALVDLATREDFRGLFDRSQGIQALRDGMYRLCEAHMNGAIDLTTYETGMIDLILALNFLVPLEICTKLFSDPRAGGGMEVSDGIRAQNASFTQCMDAAKETGLAVAQNSAERALTTTSVRADTRRFVFATLLDSFSAADEMKAYCAKPRQSMPRPLREYCIMLQEEMEALGGESNSTSSLSISE